MKLPVNAAALEIVRLRGVNSDIDEQMRVLREQQMMNSELIGNFSHVAEWIDDSPAVDPEPEPVPPIVEPEIEPEPEPEPDPTPEEIPEENTEPEVSPYDSSTVDETDDLG